MQRAALSAFFAGLIFGAGLLLSGMANPAKVLAFLDLAGAWDPSLALVMVGAIATAFPFFRIATRRKQALLGGPMHLPTRRAPDRRLVLGSLGFGVGWGLSGICPGAGYASLGIGNYPILWGIAGMFIGAYIQGYWRSARLESSADAVGAD